MDDDYCQAINNLTELWANRDVIVRAAAFELLCGLTISPRIASRLVEGI